MIPTAVVLISKFSIAIVLIIMVRYATIYYGIIRHGTMERSTKKKAND